MKISNETKVGILTVVSLVVLILGFNFLKGKNLFSHSRKVYAVFNKLGGLQKSNPVTINGLEIGTVYDLEPTDKNVTGIKATINLNQDVNIPSNSVAFISTSLLGTAEVVIEQGNATSFVEDGGSIKTRQDNGIFGDISSQVNPTLTKLRATMDSLNQVLSNLNNVLDAQAKGNLQQTIANFESASSSLSKMMADNGSLNKILTNAGSITDNFRKNNDSLTATISNAKQFSQKLAKLDLQTTLDSVQVMVSELKSMAGKLSSSNGTLGALINDKQLYNRLNEAVLSAEILMDDLRVNPKRYVNLSIFGRKDKNGPITSPAKKDSIPQ